MLKKADAHELVRLRQDEARGSMLPTLGVKGHRPIVGNLDGHDVVSVFGARNGVTGQLTTRLVERPQPAKRRGTSKQRDLQAGFAGHLRDRARAYPATQDPRVVLVVDKASWHQGTMIGEVLGTFPPLELSPLPSDSPQLQVIERFWKVWRRRATHHRLFQTMAHLKQAGRNRLRYYQTLTHRVLSLIQSPKKRTKSSGP
jgi:hypothetical protein